MRTIHFILIVLIAIGPSAFNSAIVQNHTFEPGSAKYVKGAFKVAAPCDSRFAYQWNPKSSASGL